jgi:hypothetical protein
MKHGTSDRRLPDIATEESEVMYKDTNKLLTTHLT